MDLVFFLEPMESDKKAEKEWRLAQQLGFKLIASAEVLKKVHGRGSGEDEILSLPHIAELQSKPVLLLKKTARMLHPASPSCYYITLTHSCLKGVPLGVRFHVHRNCWILPPHRVELQ